MTHARPARRALGALALLLVPGVAAAQLPFMVAPVGTLRIELRGRFDPAHDEYADGQRRDLAAPLRTDLMDAAHSPLVRDMATRLGALLGRSVTDGSLGTLAAELEQQRGTGVIGLAVGVTPRITVGIDLPIVSVRTQARLTTDGSTATLGLNPALAGGSGSVSYLTQLNTALAELSGRLAAGDYDADPALKSAALAVVASGPGFHDQLAAFLTDPTTASAVLPLAGSPDGSALRSRTEEFRDQFGERFGVTGFTASIALPSAPLSSNDLDALLASPLGFGLEPTTDPPLVALGDVRVGVTTTLMASVAEDGRSSLHLWGQAGVRLPTGTAPRADVIRDQGTGEHGYALDVGGVVDARWGAIGVRGTAAFVRPFMAEREARIALRDEFLVPVSRLTTLQHTPGSTLRIEAEPYLRLADHFALVGQAGFQREGEARWQAAAGGAATSGGDIAAMGIGTGGSVVTAGIGLSYAHDGVNKEGERKMPVEAGLGILRVVSSSNGLVADRLSTAVWFRVYKRLFSR